MAVIAGYRLDRLLSYRLSGPQAGDILFQSLPRGPLVDAIEGISQSEWSHCGVLVRKDDAWMVAEAIGEVRLTPLNQWILRGRWSRVASYRLRNPPADLRAQINAALQPFMGKPYDFSYAPDDAFIYCSELVYKAYERSFGVSIGTWQTLGSLNWQPFEGYIREVENGRLPLDRPMITPVAVTRSDQLVQVY